MSFWETPSITEVVTLIGILGGVGTLYATMRLRKTTFGLEYIKRYWDIEDRLRSAEAAKDGEATRLQVERYIRLCEDEYELADSDLWTHVRGPCGTQVSVNFCLAAFPTIRRASSPIRAISLSL